MTHQRFKWVGQEIPQDECQRFIAEYLLEFPGSTKDQVESAWVQYAEIKRLRAVFERILEEYKSYDGWDWYGYIRNALSGNDPWGAEWQARRTHEPEAT